MVDIFPLIPVILYLIFILLIARFTGKKSAEDKDFFFAGRKLKTVSSLISVIATESSVATILIFPAAGYGGDFAIIWLCAGYIAGRYLVAALYLKHIYYSEGLSIYDTVAGHTKAASFLSLFYLLAKYVSSGVRFFLGAYALYQLFGFSPAVWIVLMAVLAGIYSLSGGLRAVVYTDQIQGLLLFCFGISVVIFLLYGIANNPDISMSVLKGASFGNFQFGLNNPDFAPILFIGGTVLSIGTHGADQDMLQRVLAVRNLNSAKKSLFYSAIGASVVILTYTAVGFLLRENGFVNLDQRSPLVDYISKQSPYIIGLFAVILIAAAMSTLDSAIHSTGAVWKTLIEKPWTGRIYSSFSLLILSVTGLLFIPVSRGAEDFLSLAMGSMNYINGGLIGIFTVFALFRTVLTGSGIVVGLLFGFFTTLILNFLPYLSIFFATVPSDFSLQITWSYITVASSFMAFISCYLTGIIRSRID